MASSDSQDFSMMCHVFQKMWLVRGTLLSHPHNSYHITYKRENSGPPGQKSNPHPPKTSAIVTYFTGYPTLISLSRIPYCNICRKHPIPPLASSLISSILEARGPSCENQTSLKITPGFKLSCHIWSGRGVPCNIETHLHYKIAIG